MSARLTPTVSVCIPAYRGTTFIGEAIESVTRQTFRDFELVVIDDNSHDSIEDVICRSSDPRIRFIRNPATLGAEGNWNRCLAEARGRYVKILPQDDVLAPDCLQQQVAVLDSDADARVALVFCARTIIDAAGRTLRSRGYPRSASGVIGAKDAVLTCIRRGTNLFGEPGAVLFRRSHAEAAGGFDARGPYVIDLDYWFRLLHLGDAYYIKDALASFRVSGESWSVAIGKGQYADFAALAKMTAARRDFGGSRADLLVGLGAARVNNLLRLVFYRLFVKPMALR
jgi:glycosyltransferase involved in cell wall biosynthesis